MNESIKSQQSTETPLPRQHNFYFLVAIITNLWGYATSAPLLFPCSTAFTCLAEVLKVSDEKILFLRINAALNYQAYLKEQDLSIQGYMKFPDNN